MREMLEILRAEKLRTLVIDTLALIGIVAILYAFAVVADAWVARP